MKIFLKNGKKRILVDAKKLGFIGKFFGLMFKRRKSAKILLFEFKNPKKISMHSFFVFFPFLAIWIDDKNAVLKIIKVKPFKARILFKKPCKRIIEVPFNKQNKDVLKNFDSVRRQKI